MYKSTVMPSLNVIAYILSEIWLFIVHEGGSGTNKSAQELTRRDRKTVNQPAGGAG